MEDIQQSTESTVEKQDESPSTEKVIDAVKQEEAQQISEAEAEKTKSADIIVGAAQSSNLDNSESTTEAEKSVEPVTEEHVSQAPSKSSDDKTDTKVEEPIVGVSSHSRSSPASNARSNLDEILARLTANQGNSHPLLRRILLAASERAADNARQTQQVTLPLFRPGLLAAPLIPLFKMQAPPLRRKKHIIQKREANEEEVFLTPKPFVPFETTTTTKRPSLIERYHAMSSGEKAERISKVLEKIMHGVTIAGHVDGYLTNRAKHTIKKLHKLFATSEEAE